MVLIALYDLKRRSDLLQKGFELQIESGFQREVQNFMKALSYSSEDENSTF